MCVFCIHMSKHPKSRKLVLNGLLVCTRAINAMPRYLIYILSWLSLQQFIAAKSANKIMCSKIIDIKKWNHHRGFLFHSTYSYKLSTLNTSFDPLTQVLWRVCIPISIRATPKTTLLPWEPTTFIFRGYNPYVRGVKPSLFMVLGSKGSY